MLDLRLAIAPICLAYTSAAFASSTPSKADSIKALSYAKVHTWRQLYLDNDVEGLEAFLADDFVLIGTNGSSQTKPEILQDMKANPWNMPEDFLYTVTNIIFLTPESAIVYGYGNSTRTSPSGKSCHHNYTSSNTFRYENDEWHPVSSHVSDSSCNDIKADQ